MFLEELKSADTQVRDAADEIAKAHHKYKSAKNSRSQLIYEWVRDTHKSWLKDSVIQHNLDEGLDEDWADNISANIVEEQNEVWISLMMWDRKATRLANQGYDIEDLYWKTHRVKLNKAI